MMKHASCEQGKYKPVDLLHQNHPMNEKWAHIKLQITGKNSKQNKGE